MIVGKYEVQHELGKGRFGTVYLSTDTTLQRQVALKLLNQDTVNTPDFITDFTQDTQQALKLEHSNLVPIYDFGHENGRYFIAMGYMPNGSLKDQIAEGKRYTEGKALELIKGVARGLDYGHKQGSVHQNLKPGNIFFDTVNEPRVAEMGFERIFTEDTSTPANTTGRSVGTPAYMAPELWKGQPASPATDIYSLALIFIEAMTGIQLFGGETKSEVMWKHLVPYELPPQIREELRPVVDKAISKQPSDRYQSIETFIADLENLSSAEKKGEQFYYDQPEDVTSAESIPMIGEQDSQNSWDSAAASHQALPPVEHAEWNTFTTTQPARSNAYETPPSVYTPAPPRKTTSPQYMSAPPVTPQSNEPVRSKSKKLFIGLGIAALILCIAGAIITISLISRLRDSGVIAGLTDGQTLPDPTATATPTPEAIAQSEPTATISAPPIVEELFAPIEINRINAAYVNQLGSYGDGSASRIVWDPWHFELAMVTNNKIMIFDGYDLKLNREFTFEGSDTRIAWSPNGDWIAAGDIGATITIFDAQTGNVVDTLTGHDGSIKAIAWSPDGDYLASASTDNTTRLWDGQNFNFIRSLSGHTDWVRDLSWSPDGTALATASDDNLVKIWDPQSGSLIRDLHGHTEFVLAVSWSPDGRSIASGGVDDSVRLWDANTGQATNTLYNEDLYTVTRLEWTPDNSNVAIISNYDGVSYWDGISDYTTNPFRDYSYAIDVAFGQDGETIAVLESGFFLSLWDKERSEFKATFELLPGPMNAVAWSQDGSIYAAGGNGGEILLFERDNKDPFRLLTGHSDWIRTLAFSPDGTMLASGSDDGDVRLWDTSTWELIKTLSGVDSWILSLAWSPTDQALVTGDANGTVNLWDTTTGYMIEPLYGHDDWVRCVAWSPDNRFLASAGDDGIVNIWDATSREKVTTLTEHTDWVNAAAWSPDGSFLASSADDGYLYIWDTSTWKIKAALLEDSYRIGAIQWSPNGEILAIVDFIGYLELWDTRTGEALNYLTNHEGRISDLAWSPDGAMIVTGGSDGTVRTWSIVP